jgi:hypothetical protein
MATIDEDLAQLDKELRRLKIEYEVYFNGGSPRPPSDTQWRVEQLIKKYSDQSEMKYRQRFRYNNLAATFAKFWTVWRQRLQQREEGRAPHHYGAAARALEAERAARATAARKSLGDTSVSIICRDPRHEMDKVERLYHAMLAAREKIGEIGRHTSLEQFREFLAHKAGDLKKQGVQQVEFSVTIEDDKVRLKARGKS